MALSPTARARFFNDHVVQLYKLLGESGVPLIYNCPKASEAQALIIRLRLATEGRIDDTAAVQAAVDRAVELLKERRELRAAATAPGLTEQDRTTIQQRLKELEDLDTLLEFQRGAKGELGDKSFMGLLSAARGDAGAFGADARRLAEFATDKRKYAFEASRASAHPARTRRSRAAPPRPRSSPFHAPASLEAAAPEKSPPPPPLRNSPKTSNCARNSSAIRRWPKS